MPLVTIDGVYMASNLKTSNFNGKEKTSVYIDVYQPDSEDTEKTVSIKSDDIQKFQELNKNFSMGTKFKCLASVSAYQNKAYYKLVKVV